MGNPTTKKISGEEAQTLLHRWRSEEDAFMVGTNTLIQDNPQLNTRLVKGKNPVRIGIDFNLKSENLPLHFFETDQKTILLNGKKTGEQGALNFVQIENCSIPHILEKLHELKIGSLVVEGGTQLLNSFIEADMYDEVRRFTSKSVKLHSGIAVPDLILPASQVSDLGEDILTVFKR
jgi:diaminohydroxyphosphoribosylaminopyrimidine deaminase/5-amino-6-(5-phosphoribosylamino)uracil reductase